MATGSVQGDIIREIDDDLTCSVCLELFQNARMLKCAHTFCLVCMSGLVKERYKSGGVVEWYITCPHCREETEIRSRKTVADLPRPLPLQRLAELREKVSALTSSASSQPGSYNGNCDVCEERGDHNVKAVALCINCDTELCAVCHESHNKRFKDEQHNVRLLTNSDVCKQHPQKNVTKYCDTCKILLCPLCILSAHDPSHKLTGLTGKASERRKEIQGAVSMVMKGTFPVDKLRKLVKDQKRGLDKETKSISKRIDEQRDAWKAHIDRAAQQMKGQLAEIRNLGHQQLDIYQQDTEANVASKLSLASLAEDLLKEPSDSVLLYKSDDILQLLKKESAIKADNCVSQVPFYTPNNSFPDINMGSVTPVIRRSPLGDDNSPLLGVDLAAPHQGVDRVDRSSPHVSPVPRQKQSPILVEDNTPSTLSSVASSVSLRSRGSSTGSPSQPLPAASRPAFVLKAKSCIKTDYIKDLKMSPRHQTIYVSTRSQSKPIQIYDHNGSLKGYLGMGLNNAWGICTNCRHGIIAVCEGNCIQLFNQTNLRFLKTINNSNFQNLMFATYCEDVDLYAFTDTKEKSIHFVDNRTFKVVRRIKLDSLNILPWCISYTTNPGPGLIVNDVTSLNKKVYLLDMSGNIITSFSNPGPTDKWNPIKCKTDHLGNLLVVDSESDRVGRFADMQQELWHNLLSSENLSGGRPEHCGLTPDGVLAVGCNAYQDAYIHVFNGYQ